MSSAFGADPPCSPARAKQVNLSIVVYGATARLKPVAKETARDVPRNAGPLTEFSYGAPPPKKKSKNIFYKIYTFEMLYIHSHFIIIKYWVILGQNWS